MAIQLAYGMAKVREDGFVFPLEISIDEQKDSTNDYRKKKRTFPIVQIKKFH